MPGRLEHMVGAAAAGEGADLVDDVGGAGIDGVGRAERLGPLELGRADVGGDDRAGAGEPRALQRIQADRAAADDEHARPRLHLGLPHHRADAGHDAAADDAGAVERHLLRDGDRARLGHDRVLGMGRGHRVVVHPLAAAAHARRAVEEAGLAAGAG